VAGRVAYLDTTIPSFLFDSRQDLEIVARREHTKRWWSAFSNRLEVFISQAVMEELEGGDYGHKTEALDFAAGLPMLEIVPQVEERAIVYVQNLVMPASPDAAHLAVASYYECDFLVSWNMRHLVNPRKWQHIRNVNDARGWYTPLLQTPKMMVEGNQL